MKHVSKLACVLICTLISGCAHQMTLVNFASGETLTGDYDTSTRAISVTMPSGETLSGVGASVQRNEGGSQAYALLRSSTSKLMMEINLTYGSNGQGFGEAKTNDGKTYKIQF